MKSFFAQPPRPVLTPRAKCVQRYNIARSNLLIVVIMTLVNVVLSLCNADLYFLFTATLPYELVFMGMLFCGKLPTEVYLQLGMTEADFLPAGILTALTVIAVLIIFLYGLFWFMSKRHGGWMIAALVFFVLDTLFLLWSYGLDLTMLLDYIFHAWVLVYLILGVRAFVKLRHMPPEEEPLPADAPTVADAPVDETAPADDTADAADAVVEGDIPAEAAADEAAAEDVDADVPADDSADAPVEDTGDALDADAAFRKIGTYGTFDGEEK